jgi:hypothetical protein
MLKHLGDRIALGVVRYIFDDKAQAVVINGVNRADNGTPHITISCRAGTKPVYSNTMINALPGNTISKAIVLNGIIAAYTKNGWIIG